MTRRAAMINALWAIFQICAVAAVLLVAGYAVAEWWDG